MQHKHQLWAMSGVILLLTLIGWHLFYFLTDDAFISFRYISNHIKGYGYTWNPPPFKPVEGYSNFLWVVLLNGVWSFFRVEPPQASNVMALLFGLASLFLAAKIIMQWRLPPSYQAYRPRLIFLVLLGVVTNRTFLAWLSSGLETAMFNFYLLAWLTCLWQFGQRKDNWWLSATALVAVCSALTRPDGLLFIAATLGYVVAETVLTANWRVFFTKLVHLLPILAIAGHFLWRHATYGAWLPNTYYAKTMYHWPASGIRYALSFMLEYSLWFWLLLLFLFFRHNFRRYLQSKPRQSWRLGLTKHLTITTIVLVFLAHFGYFTFVIGGDHFEYRVYSHLIILIFLSFLWYCLQLELRPRQTVAALLLFIILSSPLPWLHWAKSQSRVTRETSFSMKIPLADTFPWPIRSYVSWFDQLQNWLISHAVCIRHQEHKIFSMYEQERLPPRDEMAGFKPAPNSVLAAGCIGLIGWVLQDIAIIDTMGLNDAVIARNPELRHPQRIMAHDRKPPPDYLTCFRPNVYIEQLYDYDFYPVAGLYQNDAITCYPVRRSIMNHVCHIARQAPLRDDEIHACEAQNWYHRR
jgi:arabinofuranosyltransferase